MKISELLKELTNRSQAEKYAEIQIPNVDFDLVELYMEGKIDLDADIVFLDADTITNTIEMSFNGKRYINLFPLYMLQEMVEDYRTQFPELSFNEMAQKILSYRINDA